MILLGDLELGFLISVYGLLFGLWVARSKRLRAVFPNSCLWVLTGVMSREDLVYCLTFWNYGDLRDHRPLSCRYYCLRDTHHYCSMHVGIKTIFNVGPCFPTWGKSLIFVTTLHIPGQLPGHSAVPTYHLTICGLGLHTCTTTSGFYVGTRD